MKVLSTRQLAKNNYHYKRLLKQIAKFKDKLFADLIKVKTPAGDILVQPQRTNNIMEQFFRDVKRHCRKKNGQSSLSKTLKGMLADTALIKNLNHADYMKILLKGKSRKSGTVMTHPTKLCCHRGTIRIC